MFGGTDRTPSSPQRLRNSAALPFQVANFTLEGSQRLLHLRGVVDPRQDLHQPRRLLVSVVDRLLDLSKPDRQFSGPVRA
jgi:hypothetical protein